MSRAIFRFLVAVAILLVSFVGIGNTSSDSNWAIVWWLMFIFVALPVLLLAVRDLIAAFSSRHSHSFRAWLMLHVCAAFAALLGLFLAWMSRASGHPKAELHQWLVLVLPALVYLTPLLLALHSGSTGFLGLLVKGLRRDRDE